MERFLIESWFLSSIILSISFLIFIKKEENVITLGSIFYAILIWVFGWFTWFLLISSIAVIGIIKMWDKKIF